MVVDFCQRRIHYNFKHIIVEDKDRIWYYGILGLLVTVLGIAIYSIWNSRKTLKAIKESTAEQNASITALFNALDMSSIQVTEASTVTEAPYEPEPNITQEELAIQLANTANEQYSINSYLSATVIKPGTDFDVLPSKKPYGMVCVSKDGQKTVELIYDHKSEYGNRMEKYQDSTPAWVIIKIDQEGIEISNTHISVNLDSMTPESKVLRSNIIAVMNGTD
jgi:hypothetical protein